LVARTLRRDGNSRRQRKTSCLTRTLRSPETAEAWENPYETFRKATRAAARWPGGWHFF
jgi:hypothetical protein